LRVPLIFRKKTYCLIISVLAIITLLPGISPAQESGQEGKEEETYSISLVRTAEIDKEIREVGDKKVLTETYTVQKGDRVWQIFRDRGLLKQRNLVEVLDMLKKLNKSLDNLDLIYPGEKIIIPLTIAPIAGATVLAKKGPPPVTVPLETIKDMDLEHYIVKPGESFIKIVKGLYDIPMEDLHNEYLNLLKKLNPSIRDLNLIHPGQTVRLPIYSPKVVRMPIKPAPQEASAIPEEKKEELKEIGIQLGEIFTLIGEEWVQTGKHFIPLKSGGQINLKADSYPIIDLKSGNRVIVDLYNNLPEKMERLIISNWDNYRIVHLQKDDDLKKAIDKIVTLCDYHKIYRAGEPLVLGGDIPLRITADWIINQTPASSDKNGKIVVVNLVDEAGCRTPNTISDFLGGLGIMIIDFPSTEGPADTTADEIEILEAGDDRSFLVETLLNLMGQRFSSKVEIPVYQGRKADFNLILKADFLLNVRGRDCIIDLSGLGQDVITLLEEHQFLVLPLSNEKDPTVITSRTLDFLGVEFDSKPHPFLAANRDESRNIRLMIPGVIFRDKEGKSVFATHLRLPREIAGFLARKGYRVMSLVLG